MTVAEVVERLPMSPGSNYGGSWLGWMLRSVLTPLLGGSEEARSVVLLALGPGHDYARPTQENVSSRFHRVKRSDAGKQRRAAQ